MRRHPRAGGELGRSGKRLVARRWCIRVREVVHELLDPHGIDGRQPAIGEEPPHVGIRRRVHVDGKRGQGSDRDAAEAVLVLVRVGVLSLGLRARCRGEETATDSAARAVARPRADAAAPDCAHRAEPDGSVGLADRLAGEAAENCVVGGDRSRRGAHSSWPRLRRWERHRFKRGSRCGRRRDLPYRCRRMLLSCFRGRARRQQCAQRDPSWARTHAVSSIRACSNRPRTPRNVPRPAGPA